MRPVSRLAMGRSLDGARVSQRLPAQAFKMGRRWRVLVLGCGDVGERAACRLGAWVRKAAMSGRGLKHDEWRARGWLPVAASLDSPTSLRRWAGWADAVLHAAPPPSDGQVDPRTGAWLRALARHRGLSQRRGAVQGWAPTRPRLCYISTTGVYGDAAGGWRSETDLPAPRNPRAWRRVDAEQRLRRAGQQGWCRLSVLRAPGIWALDRPHGDPRDRIRQGLPVPLPHEDVHTHHIHADDLARAVLRAWMRARPLRVCNVVDETAMTMGAYYRALAQAWNLPLPPMLPKTDLAAALGPMRMSFLSESRRIRADRMRHELGLVLLHPKALL
jgi:nucleoside-diphosphate-sugar epimerase